MKCSIYGYKITDLGLKMRKYWKMLKSVKCGIFALNCSKIVDLGLNMVYLGLKWTNIGLIEHKIIDICYFDMKFGI